MSKLKLHLDGRTDSGGASLVMHNEQLADPLNEWTRAIAAISRKRSKTEADHLEIARLEFLGGLYLNAQGEPTIPAWNILRCLQDGGKRHKRGADVLRGVFPIQEFADFSYDGDAIRDPEVMWKEGTFALRKTVGVQRSRTMRTRPVFTGWQASLLVEVDSIIFDQDTLAVIWSAAGKYAGLGDMRPVYGRFAGTIEEVE